MVLELRFRSNILGGEGQIRDQAAARCLPNPVCQTATYDPSPRAILLRYKQLCKD